jgi:hypothetical protein
MSYFVSKNSMYEINHTHNLSGLFLRDDNTQIVVANILMLYSRYDLPYHDDLTSKIINKMQIYIHAFNGDSSVSNNMIETLDYHNKQFTKKYMLPLLVQYNFKSDNVFKIKPFGKYIKNYYVDDIRNIDAWEPHTTEQDNYHRRTNTSKNGLNNPHIIGAHKRRYEQDISETLRTHEKGVSRISGYNMEDVYATIGNKKYESELLPGYDNLDKYQ